MHKCPASGCCARETSSNLLPYIRIFRILGYERSKQSFRLEQAEADKPQSKRRKAVSSRGGPSDKILGKIRWIDLHDYDNKRIYILLGVLAVACAVTFGVSRWQEQQENIKASGEVVLEIPVSSVEALSWEYDSQTLSFSRDDGWLYDGDAAFPVDDAKIEDLLSLFEEFRAAFIIEDAEGLGQYGLDDPICTVNITTSDGEYEILLGDYSAMDSQRYVSTGDGNVYLAQTDPLPSFESGLSDMIDDDDIPQLGSAQSLSFSGSEEYEIFRDEPSSAGYREDDVYFTERGGETVPLDTERVDSYLDAISFLSLGEYVTYNATDEELADCGLDSPELTVTVRYTYEDENGDEAEDTFTLSISRDPEELASLDEQDGETGSDGGEDEEEEEITAYARVGESQIIYLLSGEDYETLMAASYDDLRHTEVLPAEFADISQIDVSLDGETYTITSEAGDDGRTYFYGEAELDITALESALTALSADSFTDEQTSQREEISLTVYLDLEGSPAVEIGLYRYDGEHCLAVVDGESVSLVPRGEVVDLIEAVNSIVLG